MSILRVCSVILVAVLGFGPVVARAQIDPSSALLLDGSAAGTANETPIDTGHYATRPKDTTPVHVASPKKTKRPVVDTTPVTVSVPAATPNEAVHSVPAAQTPLATPPEQTPNVAASAPTVRPSPSATPVAKPKIAEPTHLNLIDLEMAAGYLYNASQSTYAYRNYIDSSPTLGVSGNVWVSQSFGLHGSFLSTLNDTVSEVSTIPANVAVTQQWFEVGVKSRQIFGEGEMAKQLHFGLDYVDYQFRVDSAAQTREKLGSSGVQLAVDALFPATPTRVWTFGLRVAPYLGHTESSTGINFHSGAGVNASSFALSIGTRYQLSRTDAIFWKFTATVERDLFNGTATVPDPYTGEAPSGVPVTNAFSLFQVGYSWGD